MPGPTLGYALTVFLSSALLLVLEIVAGRLLAPYVGVSLYSWTAIIGVILAGLSAGNWIGGVWADRGGTERATGTALALAALASMAILLLLPRVGAYVQSRDLSLWSASLSMVLALFFVPAVLLGIITPLLTTLALRLSERTGHVVGLMHALAALGSIAGTFVTGYWLIQWLGSRSVVLAAAAVLAALSIPYLRGAPFRLRATLALAAGVLLAAAWADEGLASPCDRESNYFCIRVVDGSDEVPFGEARSLVLDHLLHGTNHRQQPTLLAAPYVHLMDELVGVYFDPAPAQGPAFFFAGGGSYTQPRAVKHRYPQARVVVAELDPAVTRTAVSDLFVDISGMEIHEGDARVVLGRLAGQRFDVIVTDVFHDIAIPYHLVTREFAKLVKERLTADGLYTANVVDAFPDARLTKSVMRTLESEFRYVDVWMDRLPEGTERMTYVISASDARPAPERINARHGLPRMWLRATEPMKATGTSYASLPILTDDLVPVERLMASLFVGTLGR